VVLAVGLAEEAEEFELRLAEKTKLVLPWRTKMGVRIKHRLGRKRRLEVASTSMPNQPLEPMARSVTYRAGARAAPALTMAHH